MGKIKGIPDTAGFFRPHIEHEEWEEVLARDIKNSASPLQTAEV